MELIISKITLDLHVGTNIHSACVEALGIVAKTGLPVEFRFNDNLIKANGTTTIEEMENTYAASCKMAREEVKQDAKPELGLMPRKLYEEQRIADLAESIARYVSSGQRIPQDWVYELNDLINNQVYAAGNEE